MKTSHETAELTEVAAWRRALHRIPEPGLNLPKTRAFIAEKLRGFGLEVHERVGGGIVAVLQRGNGRRRIALRADMDALRIHEANAFEHRSQHDGLMHACGHDGHSAMLLGAARRLALRADLDALVTFIFQADEEHGTGARAMIEAGLLERFGFDEIYALHNAPGLPVGAFATREGPISSAEDNFRIVLTGVGGHAAAPHRANEALLAGCQLVCALQSIVARRIDPFDQAVVSVTELRSNGGRNILAGICVIEGDARSYTSEAQQRIEHYLRQLAQGIAQGFGLAAEITYEYAFAAGVNAAGPTERACGAAVAAGCTVDSHCAPASGSDDFGLFLQYRPGNYALLGIGASGIEPAQLHNSNYDFNDEAVRFGIAYFEAIVAELSGPRDDSADAKRAGIAER